MLEHGAALFLRGAQAAEGAKGAEGTAERPSLPSHAALRAASPAHAPPLALASLPARCCLIVRGALDILCASHTPRRAYRESGLHARIGRGGQAEGGRWGTGGEQDGPSPGPQAAQAPQDAPRSPP